MLSFEQAPPISVPLRFFLTAPLFGVAAGIVLLWVGADALSNRWAPSTLALTHLMTAGFMLQAICGALLQFIPVAAGGNVWRPDWIANTVHPAIAAATVLFAAGFLGGNHGLLEAAAVLFVLALGFYAGAVGMAVVRTPARSATIIGLRLAIVGLVVTVVLGAVLVATLAGWTALPLVTLTDVHAAWGLGGWALVLLVGVAYFVVPMFQMTPPYPKRLERSLPVLLFVLLLLWSLQLVPAAADGVWASAVLAVVALCGAGFAATTLALQRRRKRKVSDPGVLFFRGAMLCLLAAGASWAVLTLVSGSIESTWPALWIGVLIIPGAFASAICGMLYKIVPFVIWMHLQRQPAHRGGRLNMRMMLAEADMARHLRLHFAALLVLLAAVALPVLVRPAGVLIAVSYAWLGWNLVSAMRTYLRLRAPTAPQAAKAADSPGHIS